VNLLDLLHRFFCTEMRIIFSVLKRLSLVTLKPKSPLECVFKMFGGLEVAHLKRLQGNLVLGLRTTFQVQFPQASKNYHLMRSMEAKASFRAVSLAIEACQALHA
jgi:hypothetical protein